MSLEQALQGAFSFYDNSDIALKNYEEFGFHVEKNFLTSTYCDYLIAEAQSLSAAKANDFKPAIMPHKENEVFLTEMKNAKTISILNKMMKGSPVGIQTQVFYCKPGTRGFSLHQDNFYIQASDDVFISVWTALVDATEENGGLVVYPGSHKEGKLPVKKLNLDLDPKQDKNANNEETIVPPYYKAFNLSIQKGSALFIHSNLVHGSNVNVSNRDRYSLLNLYIKEGEAFRSGNSAKREVISLT